VKTDPEAQPFKQDGGRWSGRVVSKFHYTDPKTLSATQPDPRTKSVHVKIERTGP